MRKHTDKLSRFPSALNNMSHLHELIPGVNNLLENLGITCMSIFKKFLSSQHSDRHQSVLFSVELFINIHFLKPIKSA